MHLQTIAGKDGFNNPLAKMILGENQIQAIINDFVKKSFDNWEERECEKCTPDKMCKKHRAVARVLEATRAVQITGFDIPDGCLGLFIAKSDMFVISPDQQAALIIDCPPFQTKSSGLGTQSDEWIRKITPFTIGNFNKENELEISREVSISKIKEYRTLVCSMGKTVEGETPKKLVLHQSFGGGYSWSIE
jgi:hypothetical protein